MKWFVLWLLLATPAFAVRPDEMLADAGLEARARELSQGLRCLVCRNENIDDSDADLARDLRLLVRERLVAGEGKTAGHCRHEVPLRGGNCRLRRECVVEPG